jgi:ATP-dependent Lon protease
VKTVLIPQENEKDLADIPDNVKSALEIIPVSNVEEVLVKALVRKPIKIEWTASDEAALAGVLMGGQGNDPAIGGGATH